MIHRKNLASDARLASGKSLRDGDRLADMRRDSWKKALGRIVSPAIRLHHYRNIHNRILQDALCERDRPTTPECNA